MFYKKSKILITIFTIFILCSFQLVNAQEILLYTNEKTTEILGTQYYDNVPPIQEDYTIIKKEPLYEGLYDEKGNLADIDPQKIKNSLLKMFNQEPEKYESAAKNIDIITQRLVDVANKIKNDSVYNPQNSVITPQGVEVPINQWWYQAPIKTNTVAFLDKGPWALFDNYRASFSLQVSSSTESSVSTTAGFSGQIEVKDYFNFGGTYSETNTAKIITTLGTTIPAWTVWGVQAKNQGVINYYRGCLCIEYYEIGTGNHIYRYEYKTGSNKTVQYKTNTTYDRTNTYKDPNAQTPYPNY